MQDTYPLCTINVPCYLIINSFLTMTNKIHNLIVLTNAGYQPPLNYNIFTCASCNCEVRLDFSRSRFRDFSSASSIWVMIASISFSVFVFDDCKSATCLSSSLNRAFASLRLFSRVFTRRSSSDFALLIAWRSSWSSVFSESNFALAFSSWTLLYLIKEIKIKNNVETRSQFKFWNK